MIEKSAYYTNFNSPIGKIYIASTSRSISRISLNTSEEDFLEELKSQGFCKFEKTKEKFKNLLNCLDKYFGGTPVKMDFNVDLTDMTSFQRRVLMKVKGIPYGITKTYKKIAESIGNPNAARAVGQAISRNPVPLIIPCHRVVGSDGSLVGFGFGTPIKRSLLELEGVL